MVSFRSFILPFVLVTLALVSGYVVQNPRIWGEEAVAHHMDDMVIQPGTIRLASADPSVQSFLKPVRGPEFELPLPPVASLDPVRPLPRLPMLRPAPLPDSGPSDFALPNQNLNPFGAPCNRQVQVTATDAAMLDVHLRAPCHLNERVEIEHAGLRFTEQTSPTGALTLSIPALDPAGEVTINFANGQMAGARAPVATLDGFERTVLNWSGKSKLSMHAFEFGAEPGEAGHVWRRSPRSVRASVNRLQGFLVRLGNPGVANPMIAEIYSFPSGWSDQYGTIRLRIEASASKDRCETGVSARTAQRHSGDSLRWVSLDLPHLGCDDNNSHLVLKNHFQDLIIARN